MFWPLVTLSPIEKAHRCCTQRSHTRSFCLLLWYISKNNREAHCRRVEIPVNRTFIWSSQVQLFSWIQTKHLCQIDAKKFHQLINLPHTHASDTEIPFLEISNIKPILLSPSTSLYELHKKITIKMKFRKYFLKSYAAPLS